jgi:nucleoside-diphosphate-sugar epimerase
LAEKKAWEIEKSQGQWDLVTINMPLVLGPAMNPANTTSESMNILKMLGGGELKMGAPKLGLGVVDVRDVAEVHFRAGFRPEAKGRYITAAHETNLLKMAAVLLPKYGHKYPLPKRAMPKWLLMIIGPMANKLFSRKFIKNNVNIPWRADNSKVRRDLKMEFMPLKETMEDSFQVLIDEGIIKEG